MLLQSPKLQTSLARKLSERLNEQTDGEITIGRVQLLPFRTLILRDVVMTDDNPLTTSFFEPRDTLFRIGVVNASFSLKGLTGRMPVTLDKVVVRDAALYLVTEAPGQSNLKRIFRIPPKAGEKEDSGQEILRIKQVDVKDFRFTLANALHERAPKGSTGIDWADLDLLADVKGHDLHFVGKTVEGVVDDCRAREKSGYAFHGVRGATVVKPHEVLVTDFELTDAGSHLVIPSFTMRYPRRESFKHFTEEVTMEVRLQGSRLSTGTISGFANLALPPLTLDIPTGSFQGTVNDFEVPLLNFRQGSGISGQLSGTMRGLMDLPGSYIDASVKGLGFTTAALEELIGTLAPGKHLNIRRYAPDERFVFDGRLSGPARDLAFTGGLAAPSGSISSAIKARDLLSKDAPSRLGGTITVHNVDLGAILGTDLVRECSLHTQLDATLSPGGVRLSIDSLRVDKALVNGYAYSNLAAAGTYADNAFNGRVVCADPNLNFIFQGLVNLSKKTHNALYKFYFNLGYADLYALGLDKRGPSKASMSVSANFTRLGAEDHILGDIDVKGLKLENAEGVHDIGTVSVRSFASDGDQRIQFDSRFAEARFSGTQPVSQLLKGLRDDVLYRELPALASRRTHEALPGSYQLQLKTADSRDLLSFVRPGLYIADGTAFEMQLGPDGTMRSSLKSQRLALWDKYLKNVSLDAVRDSSALRCSLKGEELDLGPKLLGNSLTLQADDDRVSLRYRFDNPGELETRGDLRLACELSRDAMQQLCYAVAADSSELVVSGQRWEIDPTLISVRPGSVTVPNFLAHSGAQEIQLSGAIAREQPDTLTLSIQGLDLEPFERFDTKLPEMTGIVTGDARLISPLRKDHLNVLAHLDARDLSISGYEAGALCLSGEWDNALGQLDFDVRQDLHDATPLLAQGRYRPSDKQVQAKVQMDSLQIGYASALARSLFSQMEGKLSGELAVTGPLDRLSVASRGTRIDDGLLKIDYTNVLYHINGPFHADDYGINFDEIALSDRLNGTGVVRGGLTYDHIKDIRMATSIRVNAIEVFNTTDDGQTPLYGNLTASGSIDITGPFSALLMDVNARTDGAGDFHIPLRSNASLKGTDLLTFKQPQDSSWVDPYEQMLLSMVKKEKGKGEVRMKMNLTVRPDVQCDLEIDKESGNVLTGRGSGNIGLDIAGKDFGIVGDYTLSSGNVHFNAMNLATKDFTILSGSSIKFNGDIMDSDLDIQALHTVKASLSNLIADSTATSYRRNVECLLRISDKLRNPQLSFSIDIPDLDPSTKSQVESALNTEDKIQKQFVALLVTGNFLPDDQSGIFNNTNMLRSNMMEIFAGQLSNILQRLQIPLDLGLKYAEGESGKDLFDVAISTKLFNDRVAVNGVIGNRDYSTNGSQQDVVGDLDVEIKLDPEGEVRLSLFSHSADKYSNYLDYSQRNGVGISYQKEFNSFRTFFRDLFTPRKRLKERQERMLREQPRREDRTTRIKISGQQDGK